MQKVFNNNIKQLVSFISEKQYKNIFLVRGGNSYNQSGAKEFIENTFSIKTSFSDFNVNPQLADLEKGIIEFKKGNYDCVIAIGGGSVIDMAKLIGVFAHQEGEINSFLKGENIINNTKTPVLAIPTTAGTGAEATEFAVLYRDKVKFSVLSKTILPDFVYLSHQFSLSAKPYLTACTGLDAFSQAIESAWSVNSTDESEKYAFTAIELIWNNLQNAVNGNNTDAKMKMQEASYLAGKAINITKTTAPHALSYGFTSYYDIPHGHAVALSLPFFLNFNYFLTEENCTDNRGVDEVKRRLDKILEILNLDILEIEEQLSHFFANIGVNIIVSKLIDKFDYKLIMKSVNLDRLSNNPRKVNKEDIEVFLISDNLILNTNK